MPSGLDANSIDKIRARNLQDLPDGLSRSASQSRTVPSRLPVRMDLPSGLNATAVIAP